MIVRSARVPTGRAVRPRWVARVAVACAVAGLGAGATACGGRTVDPQQLSADLTRDVSRSVSGATVSCPSGRPADPGSTFTCTASTAKGPLVYDVTITSDAGDYRYALAPGQVVDSGGLAHELTTQIAGSDRALAGLTITCPPSILAPGGAVDVTCTAQSGTAQLPIRVAGPAGQPLTWAFVTT